MSNPFKALLNLLRKDPMKTAGVAFLVSGTLLIALSHEIDTHWVLSAEILRDLGIALCISVFIGILIEFGLARKTFERGLDAIMRQTVPPEVWDEIKQHVISQPVFRTHWTIVMQIAPNKDSEYLSKTKVTYFITSLRDLLTYNVQHEVDNHRVNDVQNCFQSITVERIPQHLKNIVKGNEAEFSIYFRKEKDSKFVELTFEERVKENDVINWWMNIATQALRIEVYAPSTLDVDIEAHHPEESILEPKSKSCWAGDGVMLPGQGFEIRLSPVRATSSGDGASRVSLEASGGA